MSKNGFADWRPLFFCAAIPAAAQSAKPGAAESRQTKYFDNGGALPPMGKLEKASHLIGMKVVGEWDKRLGKVKDLALDMPNGRVAAVIVATGGTLGMDEHYTAVPPDRFTLLSKKGILQIDVSRNKFKAAPIFTVTDWNLKLQPENIGRVYDFFGSHPYFTRSRQGQTEAGPVRLEEVERAGELLGREVRTLQDHRAGRIKDIMIDWPAGRIADVIISSGGILGIDSELTAVPPQELHPGTNNLGTLVLNASMDAITSAPHFRLSDMDRVNDWQHVKLVYDNYHVTPYFRTNESVGTAQTARHENVK